MFVVLWLVLLGSGADGAEPAPTWPEPAPERAQALTTELKHQLSAAFTIARVGPWIIASDGPADDLRSLIRVLINGSALRLERQLFAKPRAEPVKIMLFKDKDSYESWNQKLFDEKPDTPYGYYSRSRNALVMNIGTGGGTLLHELVHAMAEADFPSIPAWLNEGLGSLYEASTRGRDGRVLGLTNWRLKGLLEDLEAGTSPGFPALLTMSDSDFYADGKSHSNYAASRYLMQWLQEQGKLEDFYARVRDGASGPVALLAAIGGTATVPEIEQRVHAWVRTLTRP